MHKERPICIEPLLSRVIQLCNVSDTHSETLLLNIYIFVHILIGDN